MKARRFFLFLRMVFLFALVGCGRFSSFNFGAYSEAEKLYEKRKYKEAIAKYGEYLTENPEGNMAVIANYYMAKSYEALGEWGKAGALYEKIVREHSDLPWANFSRERLTELSQKSQKSDASL